jgi:hypothetical protein
MPGTATSADQLPDYLIVKGGVVYPRTGDSTQEIFRTPSNVRDFLKPGMLVGVLPVDCLSVGHGQLGDFYRCHHDLALKSEEHEGKVVYRVIEGN